MKKRLYRLFGYCFISFALLVYVTLVISCISEHDLSPEINTTGHIVVCVLGNSYSCDAFSYVPFILKEYGITSNIHIYYRSGCSLSNLFREWDSVQYTHYYIDTRTSNRWSTGEPLNPAQMLGTEKWDIVSLQQSSQQVCVEESYYPYVSEIINRITTLCPYEHDLAWFMAINRADNSNIEGNLQTQKKIVEQYPFTMVLPVATAVFDCQNNTSLNSIGDWPDGRLYCSDGVHLQEGLPCYIAALAVTQAILDRFFPEASVLGNTLRPNQEWIRTVNGIAPNGLPIGVTEGNCVLAQKAAILANRHVFEVVAIE